MVRDLVHSKRLISAINLSKMTGLGSEHLLLYEIKKDKFKDVEKVRTLIDSLASP